jgi:2-polyprenyl-6-methoxyphenol hydroxylase-like FAD-dependent oxidoreductase
MTRLDDHPSAEGHDMDSGNRSSTTATPAHNRPHRFDHVVVLGAGIAGLLTARVLAEHAATVTVLDRDRPPPVVAHRGGVPQSHHAHALLARGRTIIEDRFPGISEDLRHAGAESLRDGIAVQIVSPAGPLPTPRLTGEFLAFSRPLLEHQLRRRVTGRPGLTLRYGVEVTGLVTDPTRATGAGRRHPAVVGVRLRPRNGSTGAAESLTADLVVDATGRRSALPAWLAEIGGGPVPEDVVASGLGYASRHYAIPRFRHDWHGLIINGRPPENPRAGLILPIEEGRWHVSLGGFAGHVPPTDEEGFLGWARDLADPSLYEAIRVATPLTPIRGFRTPTNRLRHYERVPDWPGGLLAVGDSVCAFNPIYGQGMTVAATVADTLDRALRRDHRGGFEHRAQRAIAATVSAPWLVATGEDLRWPGVTRNGAAPRPGQRLRHRYLDGVLAAAVADPAVAAAYLDVISMTRRPAHLAEPRILARVLSHHLARLARHGDARPGRAAVLDPDTLADLRSRPVGATAGGHPS